MKNFLRIALVVAVVLCLAIAMVACGGDDTTTTAGKTTTAAPNNTAAPNTTTAAPGTTTAPVTTTVVTTTVVTTTELSGSYKVPGIYVDDVLQANQTLFETWGVWFINEDGALEVEVGPAIGELTGIEFTKGTIEVSMTMNEDAHVATKGDSGFIFALSDPFDPETPYYFEGGASYYFALVSDSQGFGISRVGFPDADGKPIGWYWMPFEQNGEAKTGIAAGPFYEDGGDVTIKIDTDGATYIDVSINGDDIGTWPIPEAENLFTLGGVTNNKVGLRAEGAGLVYHEVKINNAD